MRNGVCGCSYYFCGKYNNNAYAGTDAPNRNSVHDRYIPTLTDDFSDNKVIVTLKPEYSGINRAIDAQIFTKSNIFTIKTTESEENNDNKIAINFIKI